MKALHIIGTIIMIIGIIGICSNVVLGIIIKHDPESVPSLLICIVIFIVGLIISKKTKR